jgi:hypothetical protein
VLQRIEHRSRKVSKRRERDNHLGCMTMHGEGKGWVAICVPFEIMIQVESNLNPKSSNVLNVYDAH